MTDELRRIAGDESGEATIRRDRTMRAPKATFMVKEHVIQVERSEELRWWVSIDGRRLASFCSESRARAAGRREARRLNDSSCRS